MCPYPHPNQAHFLTSNRFTRHGSEGGRNMSASRERASGVLPTSPVRWTATCLATASTNAPGVSPHTPVRCCLTSIRQPRLRALQELVQSAPSGHRRPNEGDEIHAPPRHPQGPRVPERLQRSRCAGRPMIEPRWEPTTVGRRRNGPPSLEVGLLRHQPSQQEGLSVPPEQGP
jgi:hypothetical protein